MKSGKIPMLAFGLILMGTSVSYAAVVFQSTSALNQMAPNAETGLAGNIALTQLAGTTISNDIIDINYGGAYISVLNNTAPPDPLEIIVGGVAFTGFAAYEAGGAITHTVLGATVTVTVNRHDINIAITGTLTFPGASGGQILIQNVRLDVSPMATVGNNLNATISGVAGQATVTNPSVAVAAFVEPITLRVNATGGTNCAGAVSCPATFSTTAVTSGGFAINTIENTATAQVVVTEAGSFADAFETVTGAPTQILVQVTGIPAGLTLSDAAIVSTTSTMTASIDEVSRVNTSQSGTTGTVVLNILIQSPTAIDAVALNLIFTPASGTTTLKATDVGTVVATLASTMAGTFFPPLEYARRFTPGVTVVSVTQLLTELLSVFNVCSSSFNTGFAVANTTNINAGASGGPPAQSGTITVTLYPADGSARKSFTTSATKKPGLGIDANGNLPAGGTWSVLLSDLLAHAGITGNAFQGMVRFTCNFSNGHGINFIADPTFSVQAQGYEMLVIMGPVSGRTSGVEGLGN
jgi:hypothetical protein